MQTMKDAPKTAQCKRCGRPVFAVVLKRGYPPVVLDATQRAFVRLRDAGTHQYQFVHAQNTWAEHRCDPPKGRGKQSDDTREGGEGEETT